MELIWTGVSALVVCGVIGALVWVDRAFFGSGDEDEEGVGLPDGTGEPSSGKYGKEEVPF